MTSAPGLEFSVQAPLDCLHSNPRPTAAVSRAVEHLSMGAALNGALLDFQPAFDSGGLAV